MADRIKYPTKSFVTDLDPFLARLVEGSVSQIKTKGYQGKELEPHEQNYYFAVAVPKTSPTVHQILNEIMTHAWQSSMNLPAALQRMQAYPIGSPPPAIDGQKPPYAWKIDDGDSSRRQDRDGQAGCWIFKFTTHFPVAVANAQNGLMDAAAVKLGQYCRVAFDVAINGLQDDQAGIFMNPRMVRIDKDGPLIIAGPSAETLFGAALAAPAAMPGQAAPAYAPPPVAAPAYAPPPVAAPAPTAEQIAAQHGVQHHPGWRWNAFTRGYEPDGTPDPTPGLTPAAGAATGAAAGFPPPVSAPAVPAGATAHGAPSMPAPGSPATAFPSSAPVSLPPGVQPHPAFLTGPGS